MRWRFATRILRTVAGMGYLVSSAIMGAWSSVSEGGGWKMIPLRLEAAAVGKIREIKLGGKESPDLKERPFSCKSHSILAFSKCWSGSKAHIMSSRPTTGTVGPRVAKSREVRDLVRCSVSSGSIDPVMPKTSEK
jgi:hypothetical protein